MVENFNSEEQKIDGDGKEVKNGGDSNNKDEKIMNLGVKIEVEKIF